MGGVSRLLLSALSGEPCDAKWALVYHLTVSHREPGQAALICLTSVKKALIDFINFTAFSQREGLSARVFCVWHGLSRGGTKPFKGILKADKSLLFQQWQKYNSHVVILAYTYQQSPHHHHHHHQYILSIEVESLQCQAAAAEWLQSI